MSKVGFQQTRLSFIFVSCMIEILVIIWVRACSVTDLKQNAMSAKEENEVLLFFLWSLPGCPPSFICTRVCSAPLPKRKSLCNTRSSGGGRKNMSETLRYLLYYLEISLSCKGNFLSLISKFAFPARFNFSTTCKRNNLLMLMGIFCHLKPLKMQSF